jgi:hypothetical protein
MRHAQGPERQPHRRDPIIRHRTNIRRTHDALPQRVEAVVDMMRLQNARIDLRVCIRVLVVAKVQVPNGVEAVHAVERTDQDREVLFVAGDGDALVDELVGLGFGNAHHGARVELHPFGVGFVAVAHVFCLLVAEAAAEDFGLVADYVLGGCCVFD